MGVLIMKKLIILLIMIFTFIIFMKVYVVYNLNKEQIPVLSYHDFVYDESNISDSNTMDALNFDKQMKYLKDNDYTTLTLDQFYCWKKKKCEVPKKSVVLTFDDGYYNIYYIVKPILEKYNYHGAIFIIGNMTNDVTKPFNINEYGTIGLDIINKPDNTLEYQSHSYDLHQTINNKAKVLVASKEELDNDFLKMQQVINSEYFAYPFYTDNKIVHEILKKYNYKLAFRGESEKATRNVNDYQVPRIPVSNDFNDFKKIFETKKYNNRYGNGLIRKVFVNIERKLKIKLF